MFVLIPLTRLNEGIHKVRKMICRSPMTHRPTVSCHVSVSKTHSLSDPMSSYVLHLVRSASIHPLAPTRLLRVQAHFTSQSRRSAMASRAFRRTRLRCWLLASTVHCATLSTPNGGERHWKVGHVRFYLVIVQSLPSSTSRAHLNGDAGRRCILSVFESIQVKQGLAREGIIT